ncbi:MAG: class I SAM-dependent methyltransferase [Acidimicrobiia bacterium]
MVVFPDSPAGRRVRWLLDAWSRDGVDQAEASENLAPTFTFNRFSTGGTLLDPHVRQAWLDSPRPTVKEVVAESPRLVCTLLESADGSAAWHGFLVEEEPPHRLTLNVGLDAVDDGGAGGSSATMQVGAVGRAAHLVDDEPHVLHDELAKVFLSPEYHVRLPVEPRRGPVAMVAVIRARLAEDVVEAAYARGGRQYVLLGAGLDSFAYRRTDLTGLRVFEVDEPVSQAWKRDRLRQVGIDEPPDLTFVPVDFDTQRLDEQLLAAGFDPRQPAAFSLLGVSMFIGTEALAQTLRMVAACPGNEIAFDYNSDAIATDGDRLLQAVVRRASEPMVSLYEPDEIERLLKSCGLELVDDLSPADATRRYLAGRPDGLAVSGRTRCVHARAPLT